MSVDFALDNYFQITMSDDKAVAYIQLVNWEEGFSCNAAALEQFLADQQIRYGVQKDVVDRIVTHTAEYQQSRTPIAYATPPVHGENGTVVLVMDMAKAEDHRPKEVGDGKVDHKEITQLSNVKKGQLIASKIPPKPGIPGTTVTGEEIAFKLGKEARFKVGKNVVVSPDQSAMYAAIDGLLTKTEKGKINVFPVYEIHGDVDYSVGNIDFVGTVVIRGNVLSGFKVKAAGDIRVTGFVEGAELEADGSIDISGGIIGYHKGCIKAGQHVKSAFVQDGNVISGGDVTVSQSIMHSNVRAAQNVICTGAKGLIVGGVVQAGEKVSTRTIGNSMSTATIIEVGVLPELRNELTDLRGRLKQQLDQIGKTEKALHLLNQLAAAGQLTPEKLAMRIKLNATHKSSLSDQSQTKERILEIEHMLEDTGKARVEVAQTIYGGSKIVIGRFTRFVKDPAQRVTFYYTEGDITMIPLL
ncbi:DUF342 domain-containing protein [Paenibacillus lemnae]|uniref:DUF342 domain-containing protein n=1 Tax=Paenibacillus lemnae TaxID=1330551 RepID=A0A848M9L4_PAELE|nr:FapA family protein [Paenibacillus lemnae]NMO96184.1 DUF342 domain-containing protein [Paenibacillus lemnae]